MLVEQKIGEYYRGFDQFYNRVFIKSDENLINRWIAVDRYEVNEAGNFTQI